MSNGHIINFSTSAIVFELPLYGIYTASKAAVESMSTCSQRNCVAAKSRRSKPDDRRAVPAWKDEGASGAASQGAAAPWVSPRICLRHLLSIWCGYDRGGRGGLTMFCAFV